MCNLYLNDKIIDVGTLKEVIKNSEQDNLIFLSDIENFDYSKFNIEWLTSFHDGLLIDISHNETAKTNIIKKFGEKMESGEISNQLLNCILNILPWYADANMYMISTYSIFDNLH